jgi:rod shape-determining protein MreD
MTRRTRMSPLTLWMTLVAAIALAIVPLPGPVEPFRPPFVTMVIIYWSMMWPRLCGPLTAFVAGLIVDVLYGSMLGQHALALTVVSYLTLRFHLQIRIFPLWQLTMTAFMLMAIDAFFVFWADGIGGYPSGGAARWTQVLAGGVAWAPVMAVLDNLRLRAENRSKRFA